MKYGWLVITILVLCACHKPLPTSDAAVPDAGTEAGATAFKFGNAGGSFSRFTIKNACAYPIWIQQQNLPGASAITSLAANNGSVSYDIPAAGLASTRFWPKTGCDANGNNCKMGQSSPPCPAAGCAPPVDSKIEATWGCLFSDPSKCASTPQGHKIDMTTWWNASAVDGYTLPYTISVTGGDGRQACSPVDCTGLTAAGCPTDDDLSTGGKFSQYAHQNEQVSGPQPGFVGCFSTCMKLNYPTYGGDNAGAPASAPLQMYCCPTPPIQPAQCSSGPVEKTKYVSAIHSMCKKTVYGYAYDDGVGLRNCSSDVVITMTFGPNCP
jgi:hypothetical protein